MTDSLSLGTLGSLVEDIVRQKSGLPVIKIGSILDDVGAGVVHVAMDTVSWQYSFQQLAKSAKAVIIVPFATSGSYIEMQDLKALELIRKTIFLLPPLTIPDYVRDSNDRDWLSADYGRIWTYSKQKCKEVGLNFPNIPVNSMFVLHGDLAGGHWLQVKYNARALRKVARFICSVDEVDFTSIHARRSIGLSEITTEQKFTDGDVNENKLLERLESLKRGMIFRKERMEGLWPGSPL